MLGHVDEASSLIVHIKHSTRTQRGWKRAATLMVAVFINPFQ